MKSVRTIILIVLFSTLYPWTSALASGWPQPAAKSSPICPIRSADTGTSPWLFDLKKIEIGVGVRNGYTDPQIPAFLKDNDSVSAMVLHEVKRVLGRCAGGEENIELSVEGDKKTRELPGVLSFTVIGYVAVDKNVRPGQDTYYAVIWTKIYRPDIHNWNEKPPFVSEHDPAVIFLNQPAEKVQGEFLMLVHNEIVLG